MTDTSTRPAPPAWLNLDAIVASDLVDSVLSYEDELRRQVHAAVELANRLAVDLRAYEDRVDSAHLPDGLNEFVRETLGIDRVDGLLSVLAEVWVKLNNGNPGDEWAQKAAQREGIEVDFQAIDMSVPVWLREPQQEVEA